MPARGARPSLGPPPPHPPQPGTSRHRPPSPLRQGDLDGLCGLYVLVNAVAVLAAREPRMIVDAKKLLGVGLTAVAARMPLAEAVLDGIEPAIWVQVVQEMIAAQGDLLSPPVTVRRLFDPEDRVGVGRMRRGIDDALEAGAVVIVSLSGVHDHYTLVVRHTATRYVLHDSGALRWLAKAACGPDGSSRRHRIAQQWVVAVSRAALPDTRFTKQS